MIKSRKRPPNLPFSLSFRDLEMFPRVTMHWRRKKIQPLSESLVLAQLHILVYVHLTACLVGLSYFPGSFLSSQKR